MSEILKERLISIHPKIIMRWVHKYGNLIYQIWKKKNKNTLLSWRLDEDRKYDYRVDEEMSEVGGDLK